MMEKVFSKACKYWINTKCVWKSHTNVNCHFQKIPKNTRMCFWIQEKPSAVMLAELTLLFCTWADGSVVREATMWCSYWFSQRWRQTLAGQKSQQKPLRSELLQSHLQLWWKLLSAEDRNKTLWNHLTPSKKEKARPVSFSKLAEWTALWIKMIHQFHNKLTQTAS